MKKQISIVIISIVAFIYFILNAVGGSYSQVDINTLKSWSQRFKKSECRQDNMAFNEKYKNKILYKDELNEIINIYAFCGQVKLSKKIIEEKACQEAMQYAHNTIKEANENPSYEGAYSRRNSINMFQAMQECEDRVAKEEIYKEMKES